jgi:hypothetical protein
VFLQWLLGLRQLGFEVLFIDSLSPEMCDGPMESSEQVRYLRAVMEEFELGDSYCLLDRSRGAPVAGVSRAEALRRVGDAALLVNVMGYLDDEELLGAASLRVYLDIDPGFPQMWRELGLHDAFAGHDAFVTVGERLGQADCTVPTCGLSWIGTRQPIVLDRWPAMAENGPRRFTSIGAWRGQYGPVDYAGKTYGLRVHEFRRFFDLPAAVDAGFELALDIDAAEGRDLELLHEHGWQLVRPAAVAATPEEYRSYVAGSSAELMVAKGMYVQSRSGWFSDRSICYLASGRPVLAQDTGLEGLYPLGAGLLTFRTLEEAKAGAEEILGDYHRHARAAREIAEEMFDSDRVLSELLSRLGVG